VYFNIKQNKRHMAFINKLCPIKKKPAAQTAHLVFADTKANAEKTKRAVFCQRLNRKRKRKSIFIN